MLILTRKPEQGIVIDGTIRVRILAVDGDRIKIGIEAPDQVGVLREELAEQVAGANREAVTGAQNRQIARRLQGIDEQRATEPRQRRAAP